MTSQPSSPPLVEDDRSVLRTSGRRSAAAERALAEAAARRAAAALTAPLETGGRGGLEPVRYGDWEVKGLASDF